MVVSVGIDVSKDKYDCSIVNSEGEVFTKRASAFRKTKADRVDAQMIAVMLLSDVGLKPYTDTAYRNEGGNHYNVALSHAIEKLARLIFT